MSESSTAEVYFKQDPDSWQSVFGSDSKFWSIKMKNALGITDVGGFPYQRTAGASKVSLPISAVPFSDEAPSLKKILFM